ncbi:hypothetical protein IMY05_006G0053000 [Salix suchowensis]|nr:hypothetical protein IMY05_006G0053000 [Salix suchowensis]
MLVRFNPKTDLHVKVIRSQIEPRQYHFFRVLRFPSFLLKYVQTLCSYIVVDLVRLSLALSAACSVVSKKKLYQELDEAKTGKEKQKEVVMASTISFIWKKHRLDAYLTDSGTNHPTSTSSDGVSS